MKSIPTEMASVLLRPVHGRVARAIQTDCVAFYHCYDLRLRSISMMVQTARVTSVLPFPVSQPPAGSLPGKKPWIYQCLEYRGGTFPLCTAIFRCPFSLVSTSSLRHGAHLRIRDISPRSFTRSFPVLSTGRSCLSVCCQSFPSPT